ncbi:MAG: YihY/virulence factor BrkB family protein [Lentisphaerae bacterium]|nr:YihY/virulence factor BrkB family protein [Lentisphaerota bacterium]
MLSGYWHGLWRIIRYSAKRFVKDQLGQRAVALTYYTLFSIVPLAALLFGISKGFSLETQLQTAIYYQLPSQKAMLDQVCSFAETALEQASGGVVAMAGIIILLWAVIWLISNVESSFNAVWGVPLRRRLWQRLSTYVSLLWLTPIILIAVSAMGIVIRAWLQQCGDVLCIGSGLANVAAVLMPAAVYSVLFTLMYKFVPNTKVWFKSALYAGIIAGVSCQLLQEGFFFLQKWVFAYNRIYGSFAALPLFLIWLNWSWQIILFGAEFSFVKQHIASGVFEDSRVSQLSQKVRREHQLAILQLVFRDFQRGQGAVAEQEIANRLKLPDIILRDEIAELLDLNLLCAVVLNDGLRGFAPGVPPEKFTVVDFLRRVNGMGNSDIPEFAKFDALFAQMEKEIVTSGSNQLIHKV